MAATGSHQSPDSWGPSGWRPWAFLLTVAELRTAGQPTLLRTHNLLGTKTSQPTSHWTLKPSGHAGEPTFQLLTPGPVCSHLQPPNPVSRCPCGHHTHHMQLRCPSQRCQGCLHMNFKPGIKVMFTLSSQASKMLSPP